MPLAERSIKFTREVGFPTKVYLGAVTYLANKGYNVKKVKDWLEVNPRTPHHQDVMQRRQAMENSLKNVLINISEARKDLEMIKHDLRKFEQVKKHCEENNDAVLKADYLDLIDMNNNAGLYKLASSGRFPSIAIDFMKVKSKKDIDDLKASKSEKNILEVKLQLYNEWKEEYSNVVKERVNILREEYKSRVASLQNYKDSLRPYHQALNKIKISEGHYSGLTDPLIVEGYSTNVSGIEIVAWRGMEAQEKYKIPSEKFTHYVYIEMNVKKEAVVVQGKEIEGMKIDIKSDLVDAEFIRKKDEQIKKLEKDLESGLSEFKGELDEEVVEEKPGKIAKPFVTTKKRWMSFSEKINKKKEWIGEKTKPVHGALGVENKMKLPKGYDAALKGAATVEAEKLYDHIKKLIGGLRLPENWS